MSTSMMQRSLFPAVKPRTIRCTVRIADDDGQVGVYTVVPVEAHELPEGAVRAVRVFGTNPRGQRVNYLCHVEEDGWTVCACPGWRSHHHCKHLIALCKLGILNANDLQDLQRVKLELQCRLDRLCRPQPVGNTVRPGGFCL